MRGFSEKGGCGGFCGGMNLIEKTRRGVSVFRFGPALPDVVLRAWLALAQAAAPAVVYGREGDCGLSATELARLNQAAAAAQEQLVANYHNETEQALKLAEWHAEETIPQTAKALSEPEFLIGFVKASVVDQFKKSQQAVALVAAACERYSGGFERLETRLESAARRLRAGLETVNERYAAQLWEFAALRSGQTAAGGVSGLGGFPLDFQRSVLINTAALTGGVAFEVSQIHATSQALIRLARWLAKLLKPVIQKAAASVVPALADGPIPIGDLITAACLAWTVWDIYSFRGSVEREALQILKKTATEALAEARLSAKRRAAELSLEAVKARSRALEKALGKAPLR